MRIKTINKKLRERNELTKEEKLIKQLKIKSRETGEMFRLINSNSNLSGLKYIRMKKRLSNLIINGFIGEGVQLNLF